MAIGPLILGLAGLPGGETFYLTTTDQTLNRKLGLNPDDVLEMPFRFMNGRLSRCRSRCLLPKSVAKLVARQVRFERAISQAIRRGDRMQFCRAIGRSPWKPTEGSVKTMVDELLGDPDG